MQNVVFTDSNNPIYPRKGLDHSQNMLILTWNMEAAAEKSEETVPQVLLEEQEEERVDDGVHERDVQGHLTQKIVTSNQKQYSRSPSSLVCSF